MSQLASRARPVPAPRAAGGGLVACLLWGQGLYYAATGVWPLVHLESFERVTGEKTDDWLVITVAVLVLSVGLTLLAAAWRGSRPPEVGVLAVTAAAGLAAIDVVFVTRGTIAPIYLADAAAEAALVLTWGVAWLAGDWRGGT